MKKLTSLFTLSLLSVSISTTAFGDEYYQEQLDTYWASQEEIPGASSIEMAKELVLSSDSSIRVGVIDGGFFGLDDLTYAEGMNFTDLEDINSDFLSPATDFNESCESGHGTMIASLIGSQQDDYGIAGITNAEIVAARASKCGEFQNENIESAILWLSGVEIEGVSTISEPVDIINVSLGNSVYCSTSLQESINTAISKGVTIVAAAGNNQIENQTSYPSTCPGVINVGSNTKDAYKSYFTNYGNFIDVTANGEYLILPKPMLDGSGNIEFSKESGTSFSAPIVAGTVALMLGVNSDLLPHEVAAIIRSSTGETGDDSLYDGGYRGTANYSCENDACGFGVVNAYEAVRKAIDYSSSAFVASNALNGECDIDFFLEATGNSVDLCSLYEFVFNEHAETDNIKFEVYQVAFGSEMTTENATLISESTKPKMIISGVDEGFDYGYRMCEKGDGWLETGYTCQSDLLVKLTPDLASKPEMCE